ncbi:MAG: DUF2868 domain-containing protein [Burkholderiaceae bacterium]|nr:DUF2868 domain-containing protein [Burkholderiaceae bacterium]
MNKFDKAWCYEIIRLREQGGQSFDDTRANEIAIQTSLTDGQPLIARAAELSRAQGLHRSVLDARRLLRMGLLAVWAISFLAGASAGLASLGDGSRPVNVVWAIGSLLLLPTLMLGVWLLAFVTRAGSGGWLGHGLELLAGKVLNKGDTAFAWRAWLRIANRAKTHQWWLAFVTHSVWFWVVSGMLLSLVLAFSLRHYTFVWQTTWLSEEVFVELAQIIGALPAKFGFGVPDAQTIRASGNLALDEPGARLAWANWLIGVLLVFGWFPRLLLSVIGWLVLRRSYARYCVDSQDAYALQIKNKLERLVNKASVDAPPGPAEQWQKLRGIEPGHALSGPVAVTLEASLPPTLHAQMPVDTILLPPVDDRISRQKTEQRLSELKPCRLLVIADARQTPDRGLVRTILAFGAQAVQTNVYLLNLHDERARQTAWAKRLGDIGLTMPNADFTGQVQWLRSSQ